MKRFWWLAGCLLGVAGIIGLILWLSPKPFMPKEMERDVTATVFVPDSPDAIAERETVKYDSKIKLLTYQLTIFGVSAVMSQQPTPESFVDIPQSYDKLAENMGSYKHFDTRDGVAHITRPKDMGGKQMGVLKSKGTLMFVKADKDLSDDQWQKFFNSLVVLK